MSHDPDRTPGSNQSHFKQLDQFNICVCTGRPRLVLYNLTPVIMKNRYAVDKLKNYLLFLSYNRADLYNRTLNSVVLININGFITFQKSHNGYFLFVKK